MSERYHASPTGGYDAQGYCLKHPMVRMCRPSNSTSSRSFSTESTADSSVSACPLCDNADRDTASRGRVRVRMSRTSGGMSYDPRENYRQQRQQQQAPSREEFRRSTGTEPPLRGSDEYSLPMKAPSKETPAERGLVLVDARGNVDRSRSRSPFGERAREDNDRDRPQDQGRSQSNGRSPHRSRSPYNSSGDDATNPYRSRSSSRSNSADRRGPSHNRSLSPFGNRANEGRRQRSNSDGDVIFQMAMKQPNYDSDYDNGRSKSPHGERKDTHNANRRSGGRGRSPSSPHSERKGMVIGGRNFSPFPANSNAAKVRTRSLSPFADVRNSRNDNGMGNEKENNGSSWKQLIQRNTAARQWNNQSGLVRRGRSVSADRDRVIGGHPAANDRDRSRSNPRVERSHPPANDRDRSQSNPRVERTKPAPRYVPTNTGGNRTNPNNDRGRSTSRSSSRGAYDSRTASRDNSRDSGYHSNPRGPSRDSSRDSHRSSNTADTAETTARYREEIERMCRQILGGSQGEYDGGMKIKIQVPREQNPANNMRAVEERAALQRLADRQNTSRQRQEHERPSRQHQEQRPSPQLRASGTNAGPRADEMRRPSAPAGRPAPPLRRRDDMRDFVRQGSFDSRNSGPHRPPPPPTPRKDDGGAAMVCVPCSPGSGVDPPSGIKAVVPYVSCLDGSITSAVSTLTPLPEWMPRPAEAARPPPPPPPPHRTAATRDPPSSPCEARSLVYIGGQGRRVSDPPGERDAGERRAPSREMVPRNGAGASYSNYRAPNNERFNSSAPALMRAPESPSWKSVQCAHTDGGGGCEVRRMAPLPEAHEEESHGTMDEAVTIPNRSARRMRQGSSVFSNTGGSTWATHTEVYQNQIHNVAAEDPRRRSLPNIRQEQQVVAREAPPHRHSAHEVRTKGGDGHDSDRGRDENEDWKQQQNSLLERGRQRLAKQLEMSTRRIERRRRTRSRSADAMDQQRRGRDRSNSLGRKERQRSGSRDKGSNARKKSALRSGKYAESRSKSPYASRSKSPGLRSSQGSHPARGMFRSRKYSLHSSSAGELLHEFSDDEPDPGRAVAA